jgi:DNA-binding GntR family transcriptional regulator
MSVNKVKQGSGNTQSLVDEHCRIIDALQERQLKRAERLAEQHIGQAGKRVHETLSKSVIAP